MSKTAKALFLFIIAVMTTVLLISCGRAEIPEESISYESIPDKTSAGDIASASESETGGNSTESTTDSSSSAVTETEQNEETSGASDRPKPHEPEWIVVDGIVLPEKKDLSSCKIIPEKYDDHGEQLKRLGFSESSDEYILYDAILDISCKGAFYLDYLDGIYYDVYDKANADMFFYPYKVQLEALISDLLSAYGVGYPDRSILPLEEKSAIDRSLDSMEYREECWKKFCHGKTETLHFLSELFSVINGWEYANAAETYTAAAIQKAEYAMPFVDDFFACDEFVYEEEFDLAQKLDRITVTTTCSFDEYTIGYKRGNIWLSTLGDQIIDIEYYPVENNLQNRLVWSITLVQAAGANRTYYTDPMAHYYLLSNCIGMIKKVFFQSGFPLALHPDEYWDTPAKVSHKDLDKALSELAAVLKGTDTYSYRDLSHIAAVTPFNKDYRNENYILFVLMPGALFDYPDFVDPVEREEGEELDKNKQWEYRVDFDHFIDEFSDDDLAFFPSLLNF